MSSPTGIFRLEIKQIPVLERFSVCVISPEPSGTRMRTGSLTVTRLATLCSAPAGVAADLGTFEEAGTSPRSGSTKPNFHSVGMPHCVQLRVKDERAEIARYCSI